MQYPNRSAEAAPSPRPPRTTPAPVVPLVPPCLWAHHPQAQPLEDGPSIVTLVLTGLRCGRERPKPMADAAPMTDPTLEPPTLADPQVPAPIRLCWVVFDCVGLCWVVLGCVGLCSVGLGCVGLCWVVSGRVGSCWVVLGRIQLGRVRVCWAVLGCVGLAAGAH